MSSIRDIPLSHPDAFIFNSHPELGHSVICWYERCHLHCCRYSCAAAIGPDDYLLSKVNAYATKPTKSRLQHEVLVVTLKKTPRIGQEPDPTEHQIALQRMMKRHDHVIQPMKNADALSSEFEDSWWKDEGMHNRFSKIVIINDADGPCPTNDGFQLLPFVRLDNNSRHIAEIHLPEPPCLPPATDYNDTVNALGELRSLVKAIRYVEEVKLAAEEERHSNISLPGSGGPLWNDASTHYLQDFIPITSGEDDCEHHLLSIPDDATVSRSQDIPPYVSLTAFANLAYILHFDKQFYHKLTRGEKDVEISCDEDLGDSGSQPLELRALKEEKRFGWMTSRYFSKLSNVLSIVNSPANLAIRRTIVSWRVRVGDFHEKADNGRLRVLQQMLLKG